MTLAYVLIQILRLALLLLAVLVLLGTGQKALNHEWLWVAAGIIVLAVIIQAECLLAPIEPEE